MATKKCVSCNKPLSVAKFAVAFPCPKCGESTILRCGECRKTEVKYECPKCGFEGP